MKQLRRTIRQILFENQAHYDKLATLICSGDLESINQGVEFAETMGYIHLVEYKYRDGQAFGLWRDDYEDHRWWFNPVKPFEAVLLAEWRKQQLVNRSAFVIKHRTHQKQSIFIRLERELL